MTISLELEAKILRHFHAEHWKPGTICRQFGVHHDTVHRVLGQHGVPRAARVSRPSKIDPYVPYMQEVLRQYPRLTASRLFAMVTARGYTGRPSHFRHLVTQLRPRPPAEAYLRLRSLPGAGRSDIHLARDCAPTRFPIAWPPVHLKPRAITRSLSCQLRTDGCPRDPAGVREILLYASPVSPAHLFESVDE